MDDFTFFTVCVAVGIAFLFALAFWIGAGAPTLEDEEPRKPSAPTSFRTVSAEPPTVPATATLSTHRCCYCGTYVTPGSPGVWCANCGRDLPRYVDAVPTPDNEPPRAA